MALSPTCGPRCWHLSYLELTRSQRKSPAGATQSAFDRAPRKLSSVSQSQERGRDPMQVLKTGAIYFARVFATGFVLGTIRVRLIVPYFGTRTSELMEIGRASCRER